MNEAEFNKLIGSLKADLAVYDEMISEVSADMIAEGFTKYPVFIATAHEMKIGELIIGKEDLAGTFNIYASTLEEMLERKLVLEEKKNDFVKTYKDPSKFVCILLVTSDLASFVFLPFKKSGE